MNASPMMKNTSEAKNTARLTTTIQFIWGAVPMLSNRRKEGKGLSRERGAAVPLQLPRGRPGRLGPPSGGGSRGGAGENPGGPGGRGGGGRVVVRRPVRGGGAGAPEWTGAAGRLFRGADESAQLHEGLVEFRRGSASGHQPPGLPPEEPVRA